MTGHREVVESKVVDAGFLKLVTDRIRMPNGSEVEYQIVLHPGAVAVVPVAEDGRILMVRQHRHAIDNNLLEIPAGKLEPDEDPWTCARRELREETGYSCRHLELLCSFYSTPGFSDERIHVFLGRELDKLSEPPELDGAEPISIEWLEEDEAVPAILDGRIVDGKTIIGLALARLRDEPGQAGGLP
jgi:ADP-ribose pyrophosphatase